MNKKTQPQVTVLVYARNSESLIDGTLRSLLDSRYDRYDIVIIDDRSTDATKQQVQKYLSNKQKVPITYLRRRVRSSTQRALLAGYMKSHRGEVVVTLRAGAIVGLSFLKQAVATKANRNQVVIRLPKSIQQASLTDIIQTLNLFIWRSSYKAQVSDARHIMEIHEPVNASFLAAILLLGVLFASITSGEAVLLWYGWLLVTGYVFAMIWLHEEGLKTKIGLTFSAIPAFFLLPIASLVTGFSQLRFRN
ncbi:MAG: glycosyltransferase [Candidatus Microsaccharimonas sp.]